MLASSFFECGEELVQVEGDAQGQQLASGKLVLNVLYACSSITNTQDCTRPGCRMLL